MHSIETTELHHRFGTGNLVIQDLHLQVPKGSIYGFLGPNGAGKTTTLRLILGLLRLQQGAIFIFEKSLNNRRIEILKNIGSLIESPSIYEHLTAQENLNLLQKIYQCPKKRIGEVLVLVGLQHTNNKKVKHFSLGMKQRLAIGIAILHNPSLLILDEPTNGLDPHGILEIRDLLKTINQQKGTSILISSHLLAEIEKLVSHVGIINKGRLLFQGSLEQLMSKRQQFSDMRMETSDNSKAINILNDHHWEARVEGNHLFFSCSSKEEVASLNRQLVHEGIDVFELSVSNSDLETVFMNLINQ